MSRKELREKTASLDLLIAAEKDPKKKLSLVKTDIDYNDELMLSLKHVFILLTAFLILYIAVYGIGLVFLPFICVNRYRNKVCKERAGRLTKLKCELLAEKNEIKQSSVKSKANPAVNPPSVTDQSISKSEENVVKNTSRVLRKINELNSKFNLIKPSKHEVSFFRRTDSFPSDSEMVAQKNSCAIAARALYMEKERYNAQCREYKQLFGLTIRNIKTPNNIISEAGIAEEEYRKIEALLVLQSFKYEIDKNPVSVILTYEYPLSRGSSILKVATVKFTDDEWLNGFEYTPEKVKVDYEPFDSENGKPEEELINYWAEWEKEHAGEEWETIEPGAAEEKAVEKNHECLSAFLNAVNKISAKKAVLEKIDSRIQVIGGVYYFIFDNYALVAGCDDGLTGITVSDYVSLGGKEIPVVGILENSFKNNNDLKNIVLPETIEIIGDGAFSGCYQLKDIYVPISVKYVGNNVFASCLSLSKVVISKKTLIESNAFDMCNNCIIEKI